MLRLSRTTLEKRGQKANFDRTKICLFAQRTHKNQRCQGGGKPNISFFFEEQKLSNSTKIVNYFSTNNR
jgi:hypothetical protein